MLVQEKKVDLRVRRTRQLLQQALMELMGERDFQSITVQDISARAMVNRATFYAHFDDKYSLFEQTMSELLQQQLRERVPAGARFTPENVRLLILTSCEILAQIQGHCAPTNKEFLALFESQITTQLYEIMRPWLVAAPQRGAAGTPAEALPARVASWAIYGAALSWTRQERPLPAAEFAALVQPMIMFILQQEAGAEGTLA